MSASRRIERAPTFPEVRATDGGPLLVYGPVRITDADGNSYDTSSRSVVALCRCGHSANKPFCDGTHARKWFSAPERATPGQQHEVRRAG